MTPMHRFLIFALAGSLCMPLKAQWTTNTALNTPIATGTTDDLQALTGPSGRTYVAMFQPTSNGYSPRLQVLNELGVARLGSNGMAFNTTASMGTYTVTWDLRLDANEHVYIGFTATGNTDAVVHRLDSSGNHVWNTAGVALGQGYDVKLLPLNNGDLMVGWLDANGGGAKLRKIGASGSFAWPSAVTIASPTGSGQVQVGELMEYSNGDVLVVYYVRTGFGPSALPYAQRYTASGTAVWLQPKALTSGWYVYSNRRYSLVQRGDTAYFGMAAAQGLDLQAKVQRINPLGGLPWGANGVDVSTLNNQYERDVTLGIAPDGDALYAVAEVTPLSQGQMGTLVQKMHLKTGALPWGSAGRMLFNPSSKDQGPKGDLGFIDSKPVVVYSDGFNNGGTPVRLLAAFLDTAGALVDSIPLATYTSPKGRIQLSGASGFDVTAVWSEDRGAGSLGFAQRLNRTPCPQASAGAGWASQLDSAWLWYTGSGADSLFWDLGDGSTASSVPGDTLRHSYAANGTYAVVQYAFRSCGTSDTAQVSGGIQGIGEAEGRAARVRVGPTPTENALVLDAPGPVSAVCWDVLGRPVGSILRWEPATWWTPCADCPDGMYYLELEGVGRQAIVLKRP